jgi:hypothetical protein
MRWRSFDEAGSCYLPVSAAQVALQSAALPAVWQMHVSTQLAPQLEQSGYTVQPFSQRHIRTNCWSGPQVCTPVLVLPLLDSHVQSCRSPG